VKGGPFEREEGTGRQEPYAGRTGAAHMGSGVCRTQREAGSAAGRDSQKVEKINAPAPVTQRKLRVAAYARVSTDLDSQETSIENQCDHYKALIEANPVWELAGIYAESGVSGTKADTRPELQRLMQDCEAGAVDLHPVRRGEMVSKYRCFHFGK